LQEIWVYVETWEGGVEGVSLEAMGKAIELAAENGLKCSAVVVGYGFDEIVEELRRYKLYRVYYVVDELLKTYDPSAFSKSLHQLVTTYRPIAILFGATYNGTDVAARLAVRSGAGMIAHVITLDIEKETGMLVGDVPGFGGNIVAACKCRPGVLQIATVRHGIFNPPEKEDSLKADVIRFTPQLEKTDIKIRLIERKVEPRREISRAERVIIAGMGTGGDLTLVKKLAEKIGADVAVTRPLADMGAAPRDVQIGSTGYSLKSRLAIVAGASGATHFVSGIRDVKTVISINTDKEAPIFQFSDYCVVDDLFKIIPKLVEKL
jgi:electron transfer flavoprotein alpha subunit